MISSEVAFSLSRQRDTREVKSFDHLINNEYRSGHTQSVTPSHFPILTSSTSPPLTHPTAPLLVFTMYQNSPAP